MSNLPDSLIVTDHSQLSKFERGFKSWSENTALTIRGRLNLSKYDPISPYELAKYMKVRIIKPEEINGLQSETIKYLTSTHGDEWSAVTIRTSGIDIIVINSSHSDRRNASNIMHELSHILRGHDSTQVLIYEMNLTFRTYNALQEAEADWLASTLLLPRPVLLRCRYKNYSADIASEMYGVSTALFKYRINISGVNRQFNQYRK